MLNHDLNRPFVVLEDIQANPFRGHDSYVDAFRTRHIARFYPHSTEVQSSAPQVWEETQNLHVAPKDRVAPLVKSHLSLPAPHQSLPGNKLHICHILQH